MISADGLALQIKMAKLIVISVYKPPLAPFAWSVNQNLRAGYKPYLVMGDFNTHNTTWGYSQNNKDGKEVELWVLNQDLTLPHDAKHKPSFLITRWRSGYNPDLAFVSPRQSNNSEKLVMDPVARSQHCPISVDTGPVLRPVECKPIPKFNFRKVNWEKFTSELDVAIINIDTCPDYDLFRKQVWKAATASIHRGCRKQYIPCLTEQSKPLYFEYQKAYGNDTFTENTIELGEKWLKLINNEKKDRWQELITGIGMTHNS